MKTASAVFIVVRIVCGGYGGRAKPTQEDPLPTALEQYQAELEAVRRKHLDRLEQQAGELRNEITERERAFRDELRSKRDELSQIQDQIDEIKGTRRRGRRTTAGTGGARSNGSAREQILAFISAASGPVKSSEIAEATGIAPNYVSNQLSGLAKANAITRHGRGRGSTYTA